MIMLSCEITRQNKTIISPLSVPIANKFGRMVTYLDRLLPVKSYDTLIT